MIKDSNLTNHKMRVFAIFIFVLSVKRKFCIKTPLNSLLYKELGVVSAPALARSLYPLNRIDFRSRRNMPADTNKKEHF